MDDYLDPFPSWKQAISVVVDVMQLLKSSGFNLTKFVSNNQEILKYTTQELPWKTKLTPVLIEPKYIIQDLWKQKIDWDHPVPLDILDRWQKWKSTLDSLRTIEMKIKTSDSS